jgi:hypothetical protein
MAVATLEDLQGTLEVVVFPRMYVTNGATFAEGTILLVAGRVDHRGEEASLLADAVWVWEDAAARGPVAIAEEVAAGERGRGARRWGSCAGSGAGNGHGNGHANGGSGNGNGHGRPASLAVPASSPAAPASSSPAAPPAPPAPPAPKIRVSPLRGGGATVLEPAASGADGVSAGGVSAGGAAAAAPAPAGAIAPTAPDPISAAPDSRDLATFAPEREEPPLPDEARAAAARASSAPTAPLAAPDSGILNVRFTRGADTSRIVLAMEELRAVFKERPGATRVVFYIPGERGSTSPMEVRGRIAYDAELLAEVSRRLGEGLVHLDLATGA